MSWPKVKLKKFFKDKAELNGALQLTLGYDLTKRLEAAYARGVLGPDVVLYGEYVLNRELVRRA